MAEGSVDGPAQGEHQAIGKGGTNATTPGVGYQLQEEAVDGDFRSRDSICLYSGNWVHLFRHSPSNAWKKGTMNIQEWDAKEQKWVKGNLQQ